MRTITRELLGRDETRIARKWETLHALRLVGMTGEVTVGRETAVN